MEKGNKGGNWPTQVHLEKYIHTFFITPKGSTKTDIHNMQESITLDVTTDVIKMALKWNVCICGSENSKN